MHRREFLSASLTLGAAAACRPVRAQLPTPRPLPAMFTPSEMRADFAVLRRAYTLLHPGLTRYLSQQAFDASIAEAMRWAGRDRSPAELYLKLSRLTAAVRCGHSYANPFNQRGVVQRDLLSRPDRLPFCAMWMRERLIVTDPLATGLARGTIVDAIDGVPTPSLLRQLLPLTRADGGNDGKRVAQLELRQGDRFAALDVLRPLLHPSAEAGAVRVTVRPPKGPTQTLLLNTLEEAKRGLPSGDDPQFGWRFAIDGNGVGLLTMPNWGLYNSKWDWRTFLAVTVDALIDGKARGLIVDLRENEGGLDCGDVLLSRLIERPISRVPTRKLVRFRETPADLRPVLDTWDPSFQTLGVSASPAPDRPGFLELPRDSDETILPRLRRFAGPVAVLVGPACSSATFGFASLVQSSGVATLIGRTTGGNRRGINGGRYFFVRLPGSRMEVDLPLVGYYPLAAEPNAGIVPDIAVPITRDAIISGRDDTLDSARKLIRG